MKRVSDIFEKVADFGNLNIAYKKALRGSGKSEDACEFAYYLEQELLKIQEEILIGAYKPGRYRYFKVLEPKVRTISVAPFRDRVVHHAIVNVLEPIYENSFIYDSYATRKEKGTHRAVQRAKRFMRNSRYYLKFDINKYFDNIDHNVLLNLIKRKVNDSRLIELLQVIIANSDVSRGKCTGRGLPIGNLTSQFFANIYLDVFDHYIKEEQGVRKYIRYMDDCVVFHNDKNYLKSILKLTDSFMEERLGLRLKESATFINTRLNGLPFLGYRVFPALIRIKRENIKRLKKKIIQREQQFRKGLINEDSYRMSLASLVGYAGFADSLQLRRDLFKDKG